MLRLAADENLDNDLVHGLARRMPHLDIVRIQDVGLRGADDPTVLAWAAQDGRILLTRDAATIPRYAYERVLAGNPMSGIFVVRAGLPMGQVIDDMQVLAEGSTEGEWEGQIVYL